jgi:hypothetical protein
MNFISYEVARGLSFNFMWFISTRYKPWILPTQVVDCAICFQPRVADTLLGSFVESVEEKGKEKRKTQFY